MPDVQSSLRALPSVDRVLSTPELQALAAQHGPAMVADAARAAVQSARETLLAGASLPDDLAAAIAADAAARVAAAVQPTLRPVINATGVIIHTNLGRAPLSAAALAAMQEAGQGYSNLEYDLAAGARGSRYTHATGLLGRLTGAEAALVVNNNAAAVMLILAAFAAGREVIISRGQLVEIGGGFRIPEVMEASGARLVEVGTTNRTYVEDYGRAVGPATAGLLLVHSSNFRILGFTHEAALEELAALAHARELPIFYDLGSGSLLDTAAYGMAPEPTVQGAVQAGADLVCFSGDKLLGGPQAGIIVGRRTLVDRLARFPMTRALRVDKSTLAALQATLLSYARGKAAEEIPVWRMIATPLPELERRAGTWAARLAEAGIPAALIPGSSTVGGGSLPGETLPTCLLALSASSLDLVAARLRGAAPPVIARIEAERLVFDPRTVLPEQDEALLAGILASVA